MRENQKKLPFVSAVIFAARSFACAALSFASAVIFASSFASAVILAARSFASAALSFASATLSFDSCSEFICCFAAAAALLRVYDGALSLSHLMFAEIHGKKI